MDRGEIYMSADWAMVIITAVYVVATILICRYNKMSAEAAEAQTKEMKRQFLSTNRPIVTVEIIYLKKSFWGLRFSNYGTLSAFDTRIILDSNFIESLPEESFKQMLRSNNDTFRVIGVNQHYDLFFGTNKYRAVENKLPIIGQVIYRGWNDSIFAEDFEIEMQYYAMFYSVDSELDEVKKQLEKQNKE